LRVDLIELAVAAKLTLLCLADAVPDEPDRQLCQKLLAVLSAIRAAKLVLCDITADKPVTKREAEIDGASGLGGKG
jgi:hypothetical protein